MSPPLSPGRGSYNSLSLLTFSSSVPFCMCPSSCLMSTMRRTFSALGRGFSRSSCFWGGRAPCERVEVNVLSSWTARWNIMKLTNKKTPIAPVARRAQLKKKRPTPIQKSEKSRAPPRLTRTVEVIYPRNSREGTKASANWIARKT